MALLQYLHKSILDLLRSTLSEMKLSLGTLLDLLAFACLVSAKTTLGTFDKFHTRSLSATPLKLDDAGFEEITNSPRDYTALVLLTAMPAQFGCQLCREFQPEFDILSKSWVNGDRKGNTRTIFGVLDFPDGKSTFQKVRTGRASKFPFVLIDPTPR